LDLNNSKTADCDFLVLDICTTLMCA